ncbi:PAS domain S-box protein [Azonexus sp. IMCC34842]|uniref:PAS domain S-box protein n=1 Tax=Azonexus sp. IMCC34842 TaxID=3420950 RepID=UPI003D0DD134
MTASESPKNAKAPPGGLLGEGGGRIRDYLAEGENSFVTLFDSAPLPMSCSILEGDDRALKSFWNQAWCEAFGYPEQQVQGKSSLSFNLWVDPEKRRNLLRLANQSKCIQSIESELRHADGSIRQVTIWARRIDIEGQTWIVINYQDVTAQRQLDQALQEATAQLREFREMVESSNDAMMLVEDYRIIECNQAAEHLYGLPRASLIGKHPAELSPEHQADGEKSAEHAKHLMDEAMAGRMQRFLWNHRRADGCVFTSEVTLNPAMSNQRAGQAGRKRYISVLRDVTEANRAALALQESELRFRQLFEQSPIPLALFTPDGRVGTISHQFSQLFGYALEDVPDIVHWGCLAYPDPAYRAEIKGIWESSLAKMLRDGSEMKPIEAKVRCKNGEDRSVLIGNALIGDSMLASFYDITERRAAQAELEALNQTLESRVEERTHSLQNAIADLRRTQDDLVRSEKLAGLGSLVAGVAHELNTPIGNAVMVASTMSDQCQAFEAAIAAGLRRSVLDRFVGDCRESTLVIERNLQRAAELISSFKQVAVDQSSYQRRPFELAEVLHELQLTLSPMLRRSHVTLSEDIGAGIRMDSYPGPLTQVLMNIVNNAVIHAFEGRDSGNMIISARRLANDRVGIRVSDDGTGIDPKHLPRIFDPFFTTKLGRGGSGLGLHIVYSLITELLGGSVRMESQLGHGATVIIELPLRAPTSTSADPAASRTPQRIA